jgi:hypothetical protein
MQVIKVQHEPFMVGGHTLAHRAALEDADKPGVYNLCKHGNDCELYYTQGGTSRSVRVMGQRVKEAMGALLGRHKENCNNCVDLEPDKRALCAEAHELLAGS